MTDTDDGQPYRLLDALDAAKVPPGTSLLVTASEPAGTEFLMRLLGQGHRDGENLLVLTTKDPAGTIVGDIKNHIDDPKSRPSDRMQVIDCQTETVDVDNDSVVSQNVNTPRNLTDIGIGFKDAFDDFDAAGIDRVRFGLLSLSVILSYVDRETVYRFCQTLTRGVKQEGALGLFLLNIDAHDEETIKTLQRAFDGIVSVELSGEELSIQVSGIEGVSETHRSISK